MARPRLDPDRVQTSAERFERHYSAHRKKINTKRRQRRLAERPVPSVIVGNNADLIAAVARLHLAPTDTIADVTYGGGVFWKEVAAGIRARVTASDISTVPDAAYDFRALPYADASFDIVVLDPPYVHRANGSHEMAKAYRLETVEGLSQSAILALYRDGMREAARVARRQVWVKCKDAADGEQWWMHIEVYNEALKLGLIARDLFMLVPWVNGDMSRWPTQKHARKVHSFLWVFEKAPRRIG